MYGSISSISLCPSWCAGLTPQLVKYLGCSLCVGELNVRTLVFRSAFSRAEIALALHKADIVLRCNCITCVELGTAFYLQASLIVTLLEDKGTRTVTLVVSYLLGRSPTSRRTFRDIFCYVS